ncbi:MAG: permease [Sphaerochaetaceae bacterium]
MKKFIPLIVVGVLFIILAIWWPPKALASAEVTLDYLKEMILIMPPVFLLMGLLEVWIPKEKIQNWLGNSSGLKGGLLSVLLGTLPTGPVYVAFPLAAYLLEQGASVRNIILFLGSWAALKIPQMMLEIKFLGLKFAVVRFFLTLFFLLIVGQIMNLAFKKKREFL